MPLRRLFITELLVQQVYCLHIVRQCAQQMIKQSIWGHQLATLDAISQAHFDPRTYNPPERSNTQKESMK